MGKRLDLLLTTARNGGPLVQIIDIPGTDAYLTPDQMRALAQALWAAANECDKRAQSACRLPPMKRIYELT